MFRSRKRQQDVPVLTLKYAIPLSILQLNREPKFATRQATSPLQGQRKRAEANHILALSYNETQPIQNQQTRVRNGFVSGNTPSRRHLSSKSELS